MSTLIQSQCWPLQFRAIAKLILISLADQANDEGFCWPSIESLIKRTGLSERAVQNCLNELERSKTIVRKRRKHATTVYLVVPHLSTAPKHERQYIAIDETTRDSVFAHALNSRGAPRAPLKSRPARGAPMGAPRAPNVPAPRAPQSLLIIKESAHARPPKGGGGSAQERSPPPITPEARAVGQLAAKAARALLLTGGAHG